MSPLLQKSATQLASMIREKKVSVVELVQVHIDQIRAVNPSINAVVHYRFEEALREAQECDRLLRDNFKKLPPFYGVPCTIKEAFELTGYPHSSGLVSRKNKKGKTDATTVDRIKKAGFIILGTTNISELCMWVESNNYVYGRTYNPYDLDRTVGGSSGGEGAIISACGSPIGLASDVGGSIRIPSFFNGVFGHKPSGGSVPNTGQHPPSFAHIQRYCQPGPISRYAVDLWPLLEILAGPDGKEENCTMVGWKKNGYHPSQVKINELTIYDAVDTRAFMSSRVDPQLIAAKERVVNHFKKLKCKVIHRTFPHFYYAFLIWSCKLTDAGGPSFESLLANGERLNLIWEIMKSMVGLSKFTFPALLLALSEKIPVWFDTFRNKFSKESDGLIGQLNEMLENKNAVLLFPPFPVLAPRHGFPILRPFDCAYTAIFNTAQLPVTQCPLGLSKQTKLPLGIQVVGGHGNDHLTIAVALEIERAFGGWVPPSPLQ